MPCRCASSSGSDSTHTAAGLPLNNSEMSESTCMCTHRHMIGQ